MAKSSSAQVTVTFAGDGLSSAAPFAPPPLVNATASPSGGPVQIKLSLGENTFVVPDGAVGLLITPGNDTHDIVLRGATGETGIYLKTDAPTLLRLDVTQTTSFILYTGTAAVTIFFTWL